jgi:hypothetical protein
VGGARDPFYASGSLQLWILDGLLGHERVRALSAEIARSKQPAGPDGAIFGRFARALRN